MIASSSSARCTTPASRPDHSRSPRISGSGSSRQGWGSLSGSWAGSVRSAMEMVEAGLGV